MFVYLICLWCACMRGGEREMSVARSFADGGVGPRSALRQSRLATAPRSPPQPCAPSLLLRVRAARNAIKTEPALVGTEATHMAC